MKNKYAINFITSDKKDIENSIRYLLNKFCNCILEENLKEIENLFSELKEIRYSSQSYMEQTDFEFDKNILIDIGYIRALLDFMQLYIEESKVKKSIKKLENFHKKILYELRKNAMMSNKDICQKFKISKKEVKEIVSEINRHGFKIIVEENIAGITIYSISPKAYKYLKNE